MFRFREPGLFKDNDPEPELKEYASAYTSIASGGRAGGWEAAVFNKARPAPADGGTDRL